MNNKKKQDAKASAVEHVVSCANCVHLANDTTIFTDAEEDYCAKYLHYGNLKSFPFKKKMPCFEERN